MSSPSPMSPSAMFERPTAIQLLIRLLTQLRRLGGDDSGMSTVEYAIGTIAAAAFAAVLYAVVTGDSIVTALTALIQRALSVTF